MEKIEHDVKILNDEMEEALHADRESNINKKPAFRRLLMLPKIDNQLRKLIIHEDYLHKEGC